MSFDLVSKNYGANGKKQKLYMFICTTCIRRDQTDVHTGSKPYVRNGSLSKTVDRTSRRTQSKLSSRRYNTREPSSGKTSHGV